MRLQLRGSFCQLWRPGSQPAFRRRTPPLPIAAFEAGRNRSRGEVKQKEGIVTEPWPPAIQKQVDPPEARALPSLFTAIRFTEQPVNTSSTTAVMKAFIRRHLLQPYLHHNACVIRSPGSRRTSPHRREHVGIPAEPE